MKEEGGSIHLPAAASDASVTPFIQFSVTSRPPKFTPCTLSPGGSTISPYFALSIFTRVACCESHQKSDLEFITGALNTSRALALQLEICKQLVCVQQ